MFETLGLTKMVEAKAIHPPNGTEVIKTLASGDGHNIGSAQILEIWQLEDQGMTLTGPQPFGVEITTTYGHRRIARQCDLRRRGGLCGIPGVEYHHAAVERRRGYAPITPFVGLDASA